MHKMKALQLLLYATIGLIGISNADVPRPKGVPMQSSSLYHPKTGTDKWTCLDGSKTINFLQINDDYCDCPDNSDEPGTSACENGKYFCENIGYRSEQVISSRVNDGICDCCDGSDEYLTNHCKNICIEMGKAENEAKKLKAELHKQGAAKRADMISKGKQMRAERALRRAELELRRTEQQAIKEEKENLQRLAEEAESEVVEAYKHRQDVEALARANEEEPQAEKGEAEAYFERYDTDGDGFIVVSELQKDMTLDYDNSGKVSIEEAQHALHDKLDRVDLPAFVAFSWPRIRMYQNKAKGIWPPIPIPREDRTPVKNIRENENMESNNDDTYSDQRENEEEEHDYEDDPDVGVGSAEPENQPTIEYDPETQRFVDLANEARSATSIAENELRQIEQEIKEIDDYNSKDYGAQNEYAALDGECYNFDDQEYTYTLCPFDRASQKQKNGGAETTLGRWDSWDERHENMKYSHGSSCWMGPQRSATVSLTCGIETKITAVSEPSRCEYFYELQTPAACYELPNGNENGSSHDEL